jgi:hypothetical protein
MSTVENFCARQGNFLTQRLVFQGEVVRNLDPNENVCHQLHDQWMASSGRAVGYRDFRKSLRFELKDGSVYVWLHRDPTVAIVAGVGALGLTTAAAVRRYRAWQRSKAANDPQALLPKAADVNDPLSPDVIYDPQTWSDEVPINIKAPVFEYVEELKNVPAHLLATVYLGFRPSKEEYAQIRSDPANPFWTVIRMWDGERISDQQLQGFINAADIKENKDLYLNWDVRQDMLISGMRVSQTTLYQTDTERLVVYCGSENVSDQFNTIENEISKFDQNARLTFDRTNKTVKPQSGKECLLYVPKDSKLITAADGPDVHNIFIKIQPYTQPDSGPPTFDLTSQDLLSELTLSRTEYRRKPNQWSMTSYFSLVRVDFDKSPQGLIVVFLENPHEFEKITYCETIGEHDKFHLTCLVFKGQDDDSSDVVVKVDGTWIFYGGQDRKNPQQHLRKLVPRNTLDSIRGVPYMLVFKLQEP